MEPLTITCDTCNSRIRVRNPALLGQLVNCPKCDSMVLVAPPESAPPGTAAGPSPAAGVPREPQIEVHRHDWPAVDSAALTQEGLPAELIDANPQSSLPGSLVDESSDEYRLSPVMPDAAAADFGHAASSPAPPPIQTADQHVAHSEFGAADSAVPIGPPATSRPHLPSADWTSDSTTKTRQMLMVGFLGFAGVVLAALMFVGFLRWYTTGDTKADNTATALAVPSEKAPLPTQSDGVPNAEPLISLPEQDQAEQPAAQPPAGENAAADNHRSANDPSGLPTIDAAANSQPTSEVDADPEPPAIDDPIGQPTPQQTPQNAAEVPDEPGSEPGGEPAAGPPAAELPKRLQAFGPMLQYEIQPQFSDAMEILSEAPVTAEDLGLTTANETPEIPVIDLQSQLQIVIPALVVGELPLSQFASLWSNLSGIPTGVDLASLTAAGVDRNQSIGLAMVKSVTLGSLLDQIGEPLGLQLVPRDNRILELVAPEAAMQEHLPEEVSLAGLVDADQEAWLLEALPQLFPEPAIGGVAADSSRATDAAEFAGNAAESSGEPLSPDALETAEESFESAEESLEGSDVSSGSADPLPTGDSELAERSGAEAIVWSIEQGRLLRPQTASGGAVDPRIWSAAVHLLEAWRHAAGLPTTSASFDPALHAARLVAPSEVTELDFVLQQVQAESRPIAQVLPSICREAGLHAWMDWPALTNIGLGPQATALVVTNARPLRRALADYASEFSLVVAVLDERSLWITSNHAYRATPRLYVVPSQDQSAEVWASRLRPLTPVAPDGVGQVVVIATPDSKFMLVRCCPMQVEFH